MAHTNTIFSQLLQLIDRHDFRKLEIEYKPKRKYRRFDRWNQLCVMVFAQISNRSSLRAVVDHFRFQSKRFYHIGLGSVKRSTLADANMNRNPDIFEAMYHRLFDKCAALAPGHRFRFKNKLYSLDSTTIDLCLSLFPWARFRKSKAGIKMHTVLDHDSHLPAFIRVTDAKTHDIRIARTIKLPSGSILVVDKAYIDFKWLQSIDRRRSYFVTRMKRNTRYRVAQRRDTSKYEAITSDQTIYLTGTKACDCPIALRRVGYRDPETGKRYFFLTNNLSLSPVTIAELYRQRWQVETFFKWIKTNLKIKSFFGTTRNAVLTQIWTAMIAMLALCLYKLRARVALSLTEIKQLFQLILFQRRSIWELFDDHEHFDDTSGQMLLNFSDF